MPYHCQFHTQIHPGCKVCKGLLSWNILRFVTVHKMLHYSTPKYITWFHKLDTTWAHIATPGNQRWGNAIWGFSRVTYTLQNLTALQDLLQCAGRFRSRKPFLQLIFLLEEIEFCLKLAGLHSGPCLGRTETTD